MAILDVLFFISVVQVSLCYPDVRKRQLMEKSSNSDIINSLESIVGSPPGGNGVIQSLENLVGSNYAIKNPKGYESIDSNSSNKPQEELKETPGQTNIVHSGATKPESSLSPDTGYNKTTLDNAKLNESEINVGSQQTNFTQALSSNSEQAVESMSGEGSGSSQTSEDPELDEASTDSSQTETAPLEPARKTAGESSWASMNSSGDNRAGSPEHLGVNMHTNLQSRLNTSSQNDNYPHEDGEGSASESPWELVSGQASGDENSFTVEKSNGVSEGTSISSETSSEQVNSTNTIENNDSFGLNEINNSVPVENISKSDNMNYTTNTLESNNTAVFNPANTFASYENTSRSSVANYSRNPMESYYDKVSLSPGNTSQVSPGQTGMDNKVNYSTNPMERYYERVGLSPGNTSQVSPGQTEMDGNVNYSTNPMERYFEKVGLSPGNTSQALPGQIEGGNNVYNPSNAAEDDNNINSGSGSSLESSTDQESGDSTNTEETNDHVGGDSAEGMRNINIYPGQTNVEGAVSYSTNSNNNGDHISDGSENTSDISSQQTSASETANDYAVTNNNGNNISSYSAGTQEIASERISKDSTGNDSKTTDKNDDHDSDDIGSPSDMLTDQTSGDSNVNYSENDNVDIMSSASGSDSEEQAHSNVSSISGEQYTTNNNYNTSWGLQMYPINQTTANQNASNASTYDMNDDNIMNFASGGSSGSGSSENDSYTDVNALLSKTDLGVGDTIGIVEPAVNNQSTLGNISKLNAGSKGVLDSDNQLPDNYQETKSDSARNSSNDTTSVLENTIQSVDVQNIKNVPKLVPSTGFDNVSGGVNTMNIQSVKPGIGLDAGNGSTSGTTTNTQSVAVNSLKNSQNPGVNMIPGNGTTWESKINGQSADVNTTKILSKSGAVASDGTVNKPSSQTGDQISTMIEEELSPNVSVVENESLDDLKSNPKTQSKANSMNTLNNVTEDKENMHEEVPLSDQNNSHPSNDNDEQEKVIEQEKKLIALAAMTGEMSPNSNTVSSQATKVRQPAHAKEVKEDFDADREKKLIAASVKNFQNKNNESTKPEKVANSAELHDHAKASFGSQYFERKGEKVVKQYDEDRLSVLLDALKFGKEPATVNKSMLFANLKQCGLFVEDYNVTKIGESWNRGILSQYKYMYEMPADFSKCSTTAWFNQTDMRGSVFLSFQVRSILGDTMMNNAHVCAKYCCREPRCKAWTLRIQEGETRNCDKGSYCCWLKSAVPEVHTGMENSTSGIVDRVHTKHPPTGMRSAVPLGGITTGSFELHADGTFHEWTIENQSPGGSAKLNKGSLDLAVFGVHVSGNSSSQAALLRPYPPLGYPGVETLSYSGAYPVSKLTPGGEITERVKMDLYALPSFQPRNPYNSAIPAVVFSLNVENRDSFESVNVSFMLNLPLGSQEDTIRTGDNYGEAVYSRNILPSECAKACAKMPKCMAWTTNGPTACLLKDKMPLHAWQNGIISGLKGIWSQNENVLTMERPGFFPQSGSTTLHALGGEGEATSFAVTDDFRDTWERYSKTGMVGNASNVTSTGIHGAASIQTLLKPGQKKTLSIVMSWFYPNRDHSKVSIGNFYSNLFTSSQDVAAHIRENILTNVENIIEWQVPFLLPSKFPQGTQQVNQLPLWLNDMLMNSVSYWRSSFWTKDGRWRQWEAYDCNDIDTIHNDMQRILPYMIFYPEVVRHLLLSWAANQYSNGMIQEAMTEGCLGKSGKLDNAGGRVMADSTSMFVVGVYHYYKWTGQKDVLAKLWPSCKKAITWLIIDSTKGTGLPLRKTTFYSLSGIDKYDHHIYDSMVFLLALRAARDLSIRLEDYVFGRTITAALERGEGLVEKEFWSDHNRYYRAWWDMEYGAGDWLMSDSFYGQVWAYTLGLGDLVPRAKLRHHLEMEVEINGSPWGLRVIDDKRPAMNEEDTSLILSYKYPGCESLENISKHKSIWMGADADWTSLMIHLETDPHKALDQAKKPLDHWRSTLNDKWNIHGQISSGGYGQDGLPWANSHANAHLVMWHIPLAVSGQQYSAPELSLTFWPMMEVPFQLPFFIPSASGLIGAKIMNTNDIYPEEMFTFQVTSGIFTVYQISVAGKSESL